MKKKITVIENFIAINKLDFGNIDYSKINSIDDLVPLWAETSPNSQLRKIIEDRALSIIKKINDIDELISFLEKTLFYSGLKKLIERHTSIVLTETINLIIDAAKIIPYYKKVYQCPELKLIVRERLVIVLEKVDYIEGLMSYYLDGLDIWEYPELLKLLMDKIINFFNQKLPLIEDLETILEYRRKIPVHFSEAIGLIDNRMVRILEKIDDIEKLDQYYPLTGFKQPQKLIEERIKKIFKDLNEMSKLILLRKKVDLSPSSTKLVEQKMKQIFCNLNGPDIPDWFIECIEEEDFLCFGKEIFKQKAIELTFAVN